MIEYFAITIIVAAQIALSLWVDKRSYQLSKIWILIGFLIAQLFIFPQIALVLYGFNDLQCGMPVVALHLFFLILGGSLNFITHVSNGYIKWNKIKTSYEL